VDPIPYLSRRQMNDIIAANSKLPAKVAAALILNPELDPVERGTVRVFLRRYVTWCARSRRWKAMNGAASLFRSLQPSGSRYQQRIQSVNATA